MLSVTVARGSHSSWGREEEEEEEERSKTKRRPRRPAVHSRLVQHFVTSAARAGSRGRCDAKSDRGERKRRYVKTQIKFLGVPKAADNKFSKERWLQISYRLIKGRRWDASHDVQKHPARPRRGRVYSPPVGRGPSGTAGLPHRKPDGMFHRPGVVTPKGFDPLKRSRR